MYKQKLCLATSSQFGLSEEKQIELFKKTGFEGFFTNYISEEALLKVKKAADDNEMFFQSVHAPFVNSAHLWVQDDKTQSSVDELLRCVEQSAKVGAPIVVLHAFIGFEDHSPTALGLENFGKVVEKAKECGVKLAFENTEGEEYLAALMNEFKGEGHVGFCLDAGHEQCYNRGKNMLALYGDRLFCTHLNDNLGVRDFGGEITWIDDLHLLPFDGIIDWADLAKRLNACGFNGELTFELNKWGKPDRHENDCYADLSIEKYIAEAYKRACKFAALKLRLATSVQ